MLCFYIDFSDSAEIVSLKMVACHKTTSPKDYSFKVFNWNLSF